MQVRVKEGLQGGVRIYAGITFYGDEWRNIKDPKEIELLKASTDSLEYRNKAEEVKDKIVERVKEVIKPKEEKTEGIYTEKQLNEMEFRDIRAIGIKMGNELGIKDRSKFTDRNKTKLIAEILKIQEERKEEK